ncbi:TPA: aminomethyl-transferring glycine dehydrogenase subunit GcvPA [Staphylococcus pseudintermedius]|uniref:aminomethyl-transferring glycine dehydrogenase subunit GcvPA n=1 Tax=Staphylococcus pseudintermedius TaxID=283734 RepID=UPI0018EF37D6|nr:aminomethyl-transferring glycine dehydrogenase subunit GcvPA [Staphylococcus pseudintermedius]EIS6446206.1 aminomethyl-transferring glycine dehydrogenase subunit GcvPA [Staphylococcus pseudintermedius]MDK3689935.1 aminomethyl-transferring glycine dehydrogenase subunit GcvPA [Staphylococcus pseudintermedius]QQJ80053.1 aminomethyl-transferring glycine dehydrogenase subunit GcvPA [Staphylococcus pseudintermedius]HAR6031730.1 aminomethyl-transferring glycine dehydrogenase subunit GcvPA [Staphylo
MSHRYIPLTEKDEQEMLETIGVKSIQELYSDVPEDVLLSRDLNIADAEPETQLLKRLTRIANKNITKETHTSFLGAGVYDHYAPAVVDAMISRSEFYTAYTPYQPEISQGELQAIFEFQTMICELTAMDVANSSMYDGMTSFAEACLLAWGNTKKNKIVVSKGLHYQALQVLNTYSKIREQYEVVTVDLDGTVTDLKKLEAAIDDETAAVAVQYPNFYGSIEDLEAIQTLIADKKALFIVYANPLSLGLLTPPGEFGADIVVGDTQVFGIPTQFGGPHCGYFATTKKLMRKIPGRLVGQTTDDEGNRGFVLTLQAREQHIRRETATSNICSNQALNALASSIAMSALGKQGLQEIAVQNMENANYAKKEFKNNGFTVLDGISYNEFVVRFDRSIAEVNRALLDEGIIGGFDLSVVDDTFENHMLVAVTELRTKEEIDTFVKKAGEINGK